MKVYNLIKTLANVCRYNADGEVYMKRLDGTIVPLGDCVDNIINNKRCLVFTEKQEPEPKTKTWKVKWDSGGCAGSDVLGKIEAATIEEAEQIMMAEYTNGDPYNDDNIFLVEVK